jgi:inhibitor of cysteine peptidase
MGTVAAARTSLERLEARRLLAAALNTWTITGNSAANAILIDYKPGDSTRLRAWIDGNVVSTRSIKNLDLISVLGGAGNDRIVFALPAARGLAVWANGQGGKDKIIGGSENDVFLGGSHRDTLIGGAGSDSLKGGTGNDDCFGDDGNDYLQGNAGHDTLSGGWGDDKLTGGNGNDHLRGGANDDNLSGGKGHDAIKGGNKSDYIDGGAEADALFSQATIDNVVSYADDSVAEDDLDEPLERLEDEAALRDWLIEESVKQWSNQLGKQVAVYAYDEGTVVTRANFAALGSALSASAASDSSTTNTQVSGVDEADMVENDGEYLYLIRDQELVIIDARPAKDMKIVSRTKFQGQPVGMYLSGGRLAIISQLGGSGGYYFRGISGGAMVDDGTIPEYTEPQARVTVFDVSTPAAPTAVQTTDFDGRVQDSRVIDGRLYLVMQNYLNAPEPKIIVGEDGNDFYEDEASYRAHLQAADLTRDLPEYKGTSADGSATTGQIIQPPDLYARAGARMDVSSVILVDLAGSVAKPLASTSIVGANGIVYASHDNLYLAGQNWNNDSGIETNIVKFGLGVDNVTLEAAGEVDGSVLNQFSMDEHGRYFRLATTENFGLQSTNNVWSLDQVGDELNVIGQVDDIAKGEHIFAARFMGDRAYLVTFERVDPLFTLDMSDPTAPKVVGELVIPGFSNYLHPIDATHLVGVGSGANGSLQVSLFDVTDIANPKQQSTFQFSGDYASSTATYDPRAFAYFPDQHTLALPVQRAKGEKTLQSLALLNIDTTAGLSLSGEIVHTAAAQRAVRIGSDVYSIGADGVRAYSLADLSTQLAFIDAPGLWSGGTFTGWGGVTLFLG